MIITDFYRFEKVGMVTKSRLDCVASTHNYQKLELARAIKAQRQTEHREQTEVGDLWINWTKPEDFVDSSRKRIADRSIGNRLGHVSSLYKLTEQDGVSLAYGDVWGTNDVILFLYQVPEVSGRVQHEAWVEVYIIRGRANEQATIAQLFADGEFDDEIEQIKAQAQPERCGDGK